jgi:16S rRNA (cytidine1402-2'-O)-methyltransferase
MSKPGILFLVPVTLGDTTLQKVLPVDTISVLQELQVFIAENAKTARQFMKSAGMSRPFSEITVMEIDKHANKIDFDFYFRDLRSGFNTGLMSEAGMPGIADPGAAFVQQAHKENIKVIPLTGPSSIFLALAASGLNGQSFTFNGYLPKEKDQRIAKISLMEKSAKKFNQTQIFIETPYRNKQIFDDLLSTCSGSTLLCIASEISTDTEMIKTKTISEWKNTKVDLDKKPIVFLFL